MKKPPFDIVVLRHWREKNRDTNSGQLVTDCIAGARVVDMVDESYKNLAAHLPKGNVWLLFPESIDSAGNVVVPTHRGLPDPLPKTIVVVDGTWAEAQRMAKALPGLPRLVPQGGPRASERLLAPPQAGAMATAEAIAALIAQVDPYAAACLDRAYARHVASLKKSNPYKAAIPIVSGIAYVRNGGKTYADLMQELRWLGPASVVKIVLDGNTRQCGEAAHTVAQYLIERGFTAREDTGAGKYCSHFDLAVYTADSGWITVDPTYVQFSLPNSLSHAHRIVEKKLLTDDSSLTKEEKGARARSVLEPTVAWSVAAMQEPTVAFEVGRKTDRVEGIPKSPSASEPPCAWRDGASWREVWQRYRTIAEDIAKTGTSDGLEHYNLNYWFQQLADRIHGKRISGSVLKSNPAGSALENPIVSGIAYVANPKMVPDVPIEATVRSERIGTKTRKLAPGVHVVAQISRTGKEVWLTQGEQRLFLYLQDEQGRGSLFYQSFAGTGGKAQGYWFPSGGILADRRGRGVWVIKGNPKTDPGAGRAGLLALYQKANAQLPHSDAETDAFVKKATRVPYDDFLWEDEYEIKPTMKILEEGHANALQSKWNSWAYQFWSLNALDKTFGKRTFNIKENPLVGFERVPWKPGNSPRSEATFLSTAYPRLWEEALKNTELKIRVLVARDVAHMGDIGKNLMAINAAAKRAGEIVILLLPMGSDTSYALEGMIGATKPAVGDSQRLSRPSPFMILHNLAERLVYVPEVERRILRRVGHSSVPRSSIDPARVDTWAGRRGALEDSGNALADLFAKYVTTGKVAYTGTTAETSAIKKFLDTMVDYLKRNPGVYEFLSGYHKLPASDSDLKSLSMHAREARKIPIDIEEFLENPTDLAGRRTLSKQNTSEVREFYHATLSGKNHEIVSSMIDGIDSSRAQGHGQGAGFYLFATRGEAVKHARKLASESDFVKEVKVEGEPIIVVVDAPLTPENYDADYEVSAADFRRFLFEHKDWIRDNASKLGLNFVPASSGISQLTHEAYRQPDRIMLITGNSRATFSIMAEPPADDPANVGLAERLSTLAQRIAAVSPQLLRQFEASMLKTLPAVKYVGPKIQPARIERLDGTVVWQRNARSNPTDLAGRYIPDRYLAGLPAALQKQRVRELTQSRDDYKRGDFSELPTDVTARKMGLVKQSNYTTEAKKRGIEYRGDLRDMAQRVLAFYGRRPSAREVEAFAEALRASFAKGLAAWKSGGHRPGATAQNWAVARVNSLVVGGKTSWTADKKLFEVLPAAVRAKIESMRQKQNPISVEVRLDESYPAGYGGAAEGKHTRFLQSKAALTRIVEQGKEVVPRIKFVVDWDKNAAAKRPSIAKGERGVITLIASAATLQSRADDAEKGGQARSGGPVSRDRKVSLYTAHTILHRLGDRIMPRPEDVMYMSLGSPGFVDRRAALVVTARVENAWRLLGEALAAAWNDTGGNEGLHRWLPTVVGTKACREGWVIDGQQAMAELVPYRLLYKKGRENGVKLMSDLPFVPRLEKAFTDYIDACIDQLTGQEVLI